MLAEMGKLREVLHVMGSCWIREASKEG